MGYPMVSIHKTSNVTADRAVGSALVSIKEFTRRMAMARFSAGFKYVKALGRIIIGGPYPPSNAIIYMHLL